MGTDLLTLDHELGRNFGSAADAGVQGDAPENDGRLDNNDVLDLFFSGC